MKKVFLIFATAVSLAACNNTADTAADKKDSVDSVAGEKKESIDSIAGEKKEQVDSAADKMKAGIDKVDSASKAIDTATKK